MIEFGYVVQQSLLPVYERMNWESHSEEEEEEERRLLLSDTRGTAADTPNSLSWQSRIDLSIQNTLYTHTHTHTNSGTIP